MIIEIWGQQNAYAETVVELSLIRLKAWIIKLQHFIDFVFPILCLLSKSFATSRPQAHPLQQQLDLQQQGQIVTIEALASNVEMLNFHFFCFSIFRRNSLIGSVQFVIQIRVLKLITRPLILLKDNNPTQKFLVTTFWLKVSAFACG